MDVNEGVFNYSFQKQILCFNVPRLILNNVTYTIYWVVIYAALYCKIFENLNHAWFCYSKLCKNICGFS